MDQRTLLKIYTAIRINHATIGLSTKRTQSAPSQRFAHNFRTKDKIGQDGIANFAKNLHCDPNKSRNNWFVDEAYAKRAFAAFCKARLRSVLHISTSQETNYLHKLKTTDKKRQNGREDRAKLHCSTIIAQHQVDRRCACLEPSRRFGRQFKFRPTKPIFAISKIWLDTPRWISELGLN